MAKTTGPKPRTNTFGFLDETGLLHTPSTDKVFGLGLLICQSPKELHRAVISYRNQTDYREEFKFTKISQNNIKLYKGLIDIFFGCRQVRFLSILYDKQKIDLKKYNNDHERVYSILTSEVVANALKVGRTADTEYIAILADDVSTSKSDKFERIVKDQVFNKLRRHAVFGIVRLESHAICEIQLCDVLLGTIAYAFKIKYGLIKGNDAKTDLVKYLQKKLKQKRISETFQQKLKGGVYFSVEEHV